LRAFEVNALDYLVKPVAPERLANALARLHAPTTATPFPPSRPLLMSDRVLVKLGVGSERFVDLAEIRFVASNTFHVFAWYRIGFGLLVLLTAWTGAVRWAA
jgi:DNA-binding LytR/AlgR family response regulator